MEIKFAPTNRGFALAQFKDRNGQDCSLQKSSLAFEDAIWFGVDGEGSNRMHLTSLQVAYLLPYLQHFAETGNLSFVRVGLVGYCPPSKFDEDEARRMINEAYDQISERFAYKDIALVSGLTNVGVLKIGYEEAVKRGWSTIGVACERAMEHPLFPVTSKIVIGENWGDESPLFVGMLDAMIRVGGGKQSITETEQVRERDLPVYEYELPVLA